MKDSRTRNVREDENTGSTVYAAKKTILNLQEQANIPSMFHA